MENTNAGPGHVKKMSDEEFNALLIESVPEHYIPVITEGKTKTILPAEGQNEQPIQVPMMPEERIAEAKAYLSAIVIAGPEDTKNYNLIASALKGVTKWRTGIEKKRKELKRVALDYGKSVDSEAARLTKMVEDIEEPAKAKLLAIDNVLEEQRKAEQLRRHNLITANEWQVMGSFYVCGVHNIMMEELHSCTPERLEEIVAIGQAEKVRKEAEAVRKAEEAAAAKAEQERIAAENARLAAEAEDLRKKLAALEAANAPVPVTSVEQAKEVSHNLANEVHAPTPRMFEGHPRPQGFEVPNTHVKIVPVAEPGYLSTEPPEETPFDKPRVGTVNIFDRINGFEDCRKQVLALLNDPTPRKRSEFIELITNFTPNHG
jgi:hypothetical protein